MTTELIIPDTWKGETNGKIDTKTFTEEQKSRIVQELYNIARTELRENDNNRKQCLEQFRQWISQNCDIENCLTDDNFLLRFLRVKKFSIPMAEQALLKYLNFRKKFRHFMYDMDYLDPKVIELINIGYIFASPFRDSKGRRVILYDLGKFDLQKYNGADMGKAHAITYETLLDDEENQILGVNHVADMGAVSTAYLTLFTITEFAYLVRWGEQSFPMRHKEMNIINLPSPVKYVYDFAKSNLSQKLKDRFTIFTSKEELVEKVDPHCLPLEFGGKMPAEEMVALWKEELAAKRKRLLCFDAMELLSDKGIIRSKNAPPSRRYRNRKSARKF
ncbi:hypothetical protein NQ317_014076 [Molorchus minor]|uniref:CRAL-TRIO domain-containing protein n=1 Tax=Molorchus minor TaxID=1323400 RepID=A0ABQ9JFW3_9CUCU|nr:hypothetical protein NQ317_014076 [Molorchus minor]